MSNHSKAPSHLSKLNLKAFTKANADIGAGQSKPNEAFNETGSSISAVIARQQIKENQDILSKIKKKRPDQEVF